MPLGLTTPVAQNSIATYTIRSVTADGIDGIGTPGVTISYVRIDSTSVTVDSQSVTIAFAAWNAATGATFKAKAYAALQTALGVTGTVT